MGRRPYTIGITISLLGLLAGSLGCATPTGPGAGLSDPAAWQRARLFDGKRYDWLHGAYKVSDGYLIVGVDNHKGILIKLDGDGVTRWVRRYSYTKHDELYYARETRDGGYAIAGTASGEGENDGLLIKTGSDGREEWHRIFRGKCNRLRGLDEIEKGYILVGSTTGNEFGYVIETDADGRMVADATFGTPGSLDAFYSIAQIKGGFLLTGCTGGESWSRRYGWALTIDSALKKRHEKLYPGPAPLFLTSSVAAPEGGYLLAGMVDCKGYNACLIKVGPSLGKEWDVTLAGGNNELYPSLFWDAAGNCNILSANGSIRNTWISRITNPASGRRRPRRVKGPPGRFKPPTARIAQPGVPADGDPPPTPPSARHGRGP
ncbi:hypothetical protein LCGC14_1694700 [marine sediment metagenome]|uniref:Uncharacterized protein n=1 Tax=marine sediment metagenome TaxID=412755 RepID=A0A0F9HJT2_9ZZZZ